MKLRYKDFGSDAGSCWRQIFVVTLMPWLVKYHVSFEKRCIDALKDVESEAEVEYEEKKDFGEGVVDLGGDVKDAGYGMVGAGAEGVQLVGEIGKALMVDRPLQTAQSVKNLLIPTEKEEEQQVTMKSHSLFNGSL